MDQELYIKLAAVTKFYRYENHIAQKYHAAEIEIARIEEEYATRKGNAIKKVERFCARSRTKCLLGGVVVLALIIGCFQPGTLDLEQLGIEQPADMLIFAAPLLLFLVPAILLLIFGVRGLLSIKNRKKRHEAEYKKIWEEEYKPKLEKEQACLETVKADMQRIYKEYGDMLTFLPKKYQNLQATSFMLMAVKDGRADTLKEAYNLYEEQLHRWKLEDAAYQAAEIQRMVAMAVDELNEQQAEANAHLNAIEQYEFMKYMHQNQN